MAKVLSKYKKQSPASSDKPVSPPATKPTDAVKVLTSKESSASEPKLSLAQAEEGSEFMANQENKSQVDGTTTSDVE